MFLKKDLQRFEARKGFSSGPAVRNYRRDYDPSDPDPEFYSCVSEKLVVRAVNGQNI